jgi:hypothetical protein
MSLMSELLGGAGTAYITQEGIEQARQMPEQLGAMATDVASQVGQAAQFKPYTVTTGAGRAGFTPEGFTQTLAPEAQQTAQALQQQAVQRAGMIGSQTPESIMSQLSALRAPELERQQTALENRLAAQGRLGVQTAQYGGTPEQLAMQKAMQEQQAQDALTALSTARQFEQQDIANIGQMLTASGIPQAQLTAAMQPALTGLQVAQRPAELQAQALANLGQQQLAALPSAINAEALLRQAQLEGLTNMLGLGASAGQQQQSATGNILDQLVDTGLRGIGDVFGLDPDGFLGSLIYGTTNGQTNGSTGSYTTTSGEYVGP